MNFTMSNLFQFGVLDTQDDWSHLTKDSGPYEHAERLEQLHTPIIDSYGEPDLVIFDSNYWDEINFWQRGKRFGYSQEHPAARSGYTYRELAYHRQRIVQMIENLRDRFPYATIMWMPAHMRAWSTETVGVDGRRGSADLVQVNHSNRAVMQWLGIPVLEGKLSNRSVAVLSLTPAPQWQKRSRAAWHTRTGDTGESRVPQTGWPQIWFCIIFLGWTDTVEECYR